jgi:acetolactate synthase-1/2/3 large subunit
MPTGGEIMVEALKAQNVARVFCVPGESYLPVLAALDGSGIETVVCRHEGAAAMAAEATAKLTGHAGVVMVTRGPGAANAMSGVHVARQDSTPLVLFVGLVALGMQHREAFQEFDLATTFGGMAKHVELVADPARLPEVIARAFALARAGRPGPVVVGLPEDVLSASVAQESRPPQRAVAAIPPPDPAPGAEEIRLLIGHLEEAVRPLIIAGGSRFTPRARHLLMELAGDLCIPVAVSFRRQMLFDPLHQAYAGDVGFALNPALKARIRQADLIILLGTRFSEVPSQGYELIGIPRPERQRLVHVHPAAEELGRVYQPHLAINATPERLLEALLDALAAPFARRLTTSANARRPHMEAAHADYLAWSETPPPMAGAVDFGRILVWLRENLPPDTIVTNGAGNYALWVHRFWRYRDWATQAAPVSGSMGYGLPAAIAAALAFPGRSVLCFAGDGCFQMTMQELATAVQLRLPIRIIVADNGQYGTIRMHQHRRFPGRDCATTLHNPDFAALAEATGAAAWRIEKTEDFAPAFRAAGQLTDRPALFHLRLDPTALAPGLNLDENG